MSTTFPQRLERHSPRWQSAKGKQRTWIQLPSTVLQTRYRLCAVEHTFRNTETGTAIQDALHQWQEQHSERFHQYYLIAQPHADAPCYNITDAVQQCVAGKLAIAKRLSGRTVLCLYQTEEAAADLLHHTGVSTFVQRVLVSYLNRYDTNAIIGFACELPQFLSIWRNEPATVPWSPALWGDEESQFGGGGGGGGGGTESFTPKVPQRLHQEEIEKQSKAWFHAYLPLLFYETYDTSAFRSAFWQEITTRFSTGFLAGVRDFCHRHGLKFALKLPTSAAALEFALGTMLTQVDYPILEASALDTPRRFVVAKWVCSTTSHAEISRKPPHKSTQVLQDAALGFNLWSPSDRKRDDIRNGTQEMLTHLLTRGHPKRTLLMIAPTQSMWTKPDEKLWNTLTKAWGWLCNVVTDLGYALRIISEPELTAAQVQRRPAALRLDTSPEEIYRVVLLPSCISLQEETVTCLRAFTKAKGRIIANEPTPYLLNGRIGLEPYPLEQLIYGLRTTILRGPLNERALALKKYLKKWVTPILSVYVKPEHEPTQVLQLHHRVAEETHLFYLFNTSAELTDTLIEIHDVAQNVEEIDLTTGNTTLVDFWNADRKTYLNCRFKPEQAKFFRVLCQNKNRHERRRA